MTRRKVEIKKIENKSSRQVAFSKRRKGLLKKAQDLSVLCDADVAVIVFSNRGRLYDFCSAQSFPEMLQRYWAGVGEKSIKNAYEVEDGSSWISSIQKCAELLQMLNRNLEEKSIGKLSVTELVQLEKQLDCARQEIISRKTKLQLESIAALHEQENKLLEEKKLLQQEIADIKEMKKAGENVEERIQKDCEGLDDHQPQQLVTLDLLR